MPTASSPCRWCSTTPTPTPTRTSASWSPASRARPSCPDRRNRGGAPRDGAPPPRPADGGHATLEQNDAAVAESDQPDRPPLLDVRDVTVRFGGVTALSELTFAIREGDICGL